MERIEISFIFFIFSIFVVEVSRQPDHDGAAGGVGRVRGGLCGVRLSPGRAGLPGVPRGLHHTRGLQLR